MTNAQSCEILSCIDLTLAHLVPSSTQDRHQVGSHCRHEENIRICTSYGRSTSVLCVAATIGAH